MKKFLLIGQAVKPQGVRGEIKVLPATDDVERFCDLENVFLDEKGEVCKKVARARALPTSSSRAWTTATKRNACVVAAFISTARTPCRCRKGDTISPI